LSIKSGKAGARGIAVSFRQGLERRLELSVKAELRGHRAEVDNLGPDRQRRHELRPLQRLGCVRHCRELAVHAAFPIVP